VAAVPDIGTVHDRERFAKDRGALLALYAGPTAGEIRGWYVRRTASRNVAPTLYRRHVWHRWQIRGFVGFVDTASSEHLMDRLVEGIDAAIPPDATLAGLIKGCRVALGSAEVGGVQVDDLGPATLAGEVLVHAADLSLVTWHVE
jgi:hypothetical protein